MPLSEKLSSVIPQFKQPRPQLVIGGQPEASAWPAIRDAGVTTVVNLRADAEVPGRDEQAEVLGAGLNYVSVPVQGPADLDPNQVAKLWQVLSDAPGAVLVHCGTGNRCGAMLALAEAWHRGRDADDAVAFGRQAGLQSLEPAVRGLLAK